MSGKRPVQWRGVAVVVGALGIAAVGGCHSSNPSMTPENRGGPTRDINAVLADHDRELLAMPGVVGVYVGLLNDDRTQCLKVMLARKDRTLERSIPRFLEGYRVVTEVTGEIKPLDSGTKSR